MKFLAREENNGKGFQKLSFFCIIET